MPRDRSNRSRSQAPLGGEQRPPRAPDLASLHARLDHVTLLDADRIRARLARLARGSNGNRPAPPRGILAEVEDRIASAEDRYQRRLDALPTPEYPDDLPVSARRREIADAIRDNQVTVLCGETGSGKTTQLPKICLDRSFGLGRGVAGLIGHTQPRRIAARSVADRIADELHARPGSIVGSKVRFSDQTSDTTLVKLMTDGILLAETQGDPTLLQYDTLIIDEAHERSLNIDFLLGYLTTVLPKRPDLKLVITSATIDPQRFADHFEKILHARVPVILVEGRTYPVEVRYRPLLTDDFDAQDSDSAPQVATTLDTDTAKPEHFPRTADPSQAVIDCVEEIDRDPTLREQGITGDILVFMPGEREIRETADALSKRFGAHQHRGQGASGGLEILPLYARLSPNEQQRIFRPAPGGARRVVIATNVAETSLTVPGISFVIDAGTARISRYSPRTRVQGLPVEAISRASADQRKGRCGRVSPGVCFRLYSEADFDSREEFTPPEILRTNLASVVLQMASLSLGRPERFPFVEPPDTRLIRDGYQTLRELGAVEDVPRTGQPTLTDSGKELARLPIDPRLGRMLLAGVQEKCLPEVLVIAAGLSVQDPRDRPHDKRDAADKAHAEHQDDHSDYVTLLNLWHFWHDTLRPLSRSKRTKACRQAFLSERRLREWADVVTQLRQVMSELGYNPTPKQQRRRQTRSERRDATKRTKDEVLAQLNREQKPELPTDAAHNHIHRALLTGNLTSIGYRPKKHEYQSPGGGRFNIHPGSALFAVKPKWVMAAELVRTTKLYARTVAAIQPEWIEDLGGHLLKRSYSNPRWDPKAGRVRADERVSLGGLDIVTRRPKNFGAIDPDASREIFIMQGLVDGEINTAAPAYMHNRELIDEIRRLEDKARRRNLLAEVDAIYNFYDRRLPPDVWSTQRFEKWLRNAEKDAPDVLRMSKEDLLVGDAAGIDESAYPDAAPVAGSTLPLKYRFAPGDDDDGVTLTVPITVLGQVRDDDQHLLVPGMLADKVEALLRTLPKRFRKYIDPVRHARKLAPQAEDALKADRTKTLESHLANILSRETGLAINAQDFDTQALPDHLALRYRVIPDGGPDGPPDGGDSNSNKPLAISRDLTHLRTQFADQIRAAFRSRAAQTFDQDHLAGFDIDELPKSVTIEAGHTNAAGYPAFVDLAAKAPVPGPVHPAAYAEGLPLAKDKQGPAGLRLFEDKHTQTLAHRRGLLRLLAGRLQTEFRLDERSLPGLDQLALRFSPIGPPEHFKDELMLAIADNVFFQGDPAAPGRVRTPRDFELALDRGWQHLQKRAGETTDLVRDALTRMTRVKALIEEEHPESWRIAVADTADQLAHLFHTRVLSETPLAWLRCYPRYLRAIEIRFDRLRGGGEDRDRARTAEARAHWKNYLAARESLANTRGQDERLDEFRWLIEELRVSLFAQELRTAVPVSTARLDKRWSQISR